jgi:protein-tyrosine phosphatase
VTRSALAALSREGVTHLALTPHYYPSRKPMHRFLARREDSYRALLEMPEAKPFHLSLGAEVYFSEVLFNYEDLSSLCYQNTNVMLTELEYDDTFTQSTRRRLLRLIEDYRITPLLAHIDRYDYLMRNPSLVSELREMGCLVQANSQSFLKFWKGRSLVSFVKKGLVDVLGEDIHRTLLTEKERSRAWARISKRAPEFLSLADERAKKLIFLL